MTEKLEKKRPLRCLITTIDEKESVVGEADVKWDPEKRRVTFTQWFSLPKPFGTSEVEMLINRCGVGHLEDGTMGSCLTVHHPDRDPENEKARTEALCARCHLRDEAQARRRPGKEQLVLW